MKKEDVIAALAALAQETRLDIFRFLVERGPDGAAAGKIAERLGLPAPTLSFHLKALQHAGLIFRRRQSQSLIYGADFDGMRGLLAYLTENCCGGQPELCQPTAPSAASAIKRRQRSQ